MKKLFLLLLLAATFPALAQKAASRLFYQKAISFSPLALADIDHTLLLTGEYRFHPKLALTTDAGFIFASNYMNNTQKTSGFNIRPSLRFYHGKRGRGYLQAQAFYKQVTYTLNDWVGKDCVNGVPAYEQQQDFDYRKKVVGFHLIAGALLPLSPSHKWLIDLYGGLGFRYKKQDVVDGQNICYNREAGLLDFNQDNVTLPSLPMGLRLTYVLR